MGSLIDKYLDGDLNEEEAVTFLEAIARDPTEPYYQEQRRRFLGERDRDNRPDAPSPWRAPPPSDPGYEPMETGLTV